MNKKRHDKPLTEAQKEFYAGFKTTRNQIPAEIFAQNFSTIYLKEAEKRFGDIIPNDPVMLSDLAVVVAQAIANEIKRRQQA